MIRWLLGALGLGGAGYLIYRGQKSPSSGPSIFARFNVTPEGVSPGPWRANKLSGKTDNGLREKGQRYMVTISTPGLMDDAVVEGLWTAEDSANNKPGVLKVDRLVYQIRGKAPPLPFKLEIPPSKRALENDYLEATRWEAAHPTSVSERAHAGGKPAPGTKIRYVMRERNTLGHAVVVLSGKVLADDSSYWPKDEGSPDDERVLVSADNIERAVRGGTNIGLPPAFVVPVDHLISFE